MIAYLRGNFSFKSPAVVHVDVQGVGYEVQISLHTFSRIQHLEQGLLHTCLLIREDAHILYGFFDMAEKDMFLMLLSVSGIGAATARVMLSYMKPEDLSRAIAQADVHTLEGIKGIGKKSAERIVVELKDKLIKKPVESNISALKDNSLHTDALNALLALGIPRTAGEKALRKVAQSLPDSVSVEEMIKQALQNL